MSGDRVITGQRAALAAMVVTPRLCA